MLDRDAMTTTSRRARAPWPRHSHELRAPSPTAHDRTWLGRITWMCRRWKRVMEAASPCASVDDAGAEP